MKEEQPPKPQPKDPLAIIRLFVENGQYNIAEQKIDEWGLKVKIENGQIIDISNTTESWLRRFITVHPRMMTLKDKVRKLSKIDDEVLIVGPTGTGKELLARALHGEREGHFLAINCAGIPDLLLESILFGHVKGSFTDAKETRNGYFQRAVNGTLFLDEIGELKMELQGKLLRTLQERKVTKVGADKEEEVNCRVVCATNRMLKAMALEVPPLFRVDLYARISTFELETLPLSSRLEDVIPILQSLEGGKEFLEKINVSNLSLDLTLNVRSLQRYVRRYKVLGELPV